MDKRLVWLDCDPGHDDAIAILLACHCNKIDLVGLSTVHGNAPASSTWTNALRLVVAFAREDVPVYPGAAKPLIRPARSDPEIHGIDGLGGVQGLPDAQHAAVLGLAQAAKGRRAIEGMARAVEKVLASGQKITFVTTGPTTNLALFVSAYPDLVPAIEEIIFMGGGVGLGNRSAVAEFNILCDPEAAQIVLDVPVPKVMIPINVTHQAIFTPDLFARLCPSLEDQSTNSTTSTSLRQMLSTVLTFFAATYKSTFGFESGPPLHDALTIAYLAKPELFRLQRYRVDVEMAGALTAGETVVDVWNYRKTDSSWGATGKNCLVAQEVDVSGFFDFFFETVDACDKVSPLNH